MLYPIFPAAALPAIADIQNLTVQPEQNSIFTSKVNLSSSESIEINFTTPSFVLAQASSSQKAEANRLVQQGIEKLNQRQVSAAQNLLQQALNIYRQIKDTLGEGETLKNLGNAYYLQADYAQAINYQQQAVKIAQQIRNRNLESRALLNIGNAYRDWKSYPKAINYYQKSLAIARKFKIQEVEGIAIGNLGITYYESKNYPKAIEILQQGLTISRAIKDKKLESLSLVYLGQGHTALQEYAKAIKYYQQALVITRKTDNRRQEAIIAAALGFAYEKIGNKQKARDFYQLQLILAQGFQDKEQEIVARKSIERLQLPSDYQGLEQGRQKLQQARKSNNPPAMVLAVINTGMIYNQQANYSEAEKALTLGLQLARDIKNPLLEAQALLELGNTYSLQQKTNKAIQLYKQSLAISQQIKNTNNSQIKNLGIEIERIALIQIATNYELQGDLRQGIKYRQQDLAIARTLKNPLREGRAIYALGNIFSEQGNHIQAINYFQQSLQTGQKANNLVLQVQSLGTLGNTYLLLGDFKQAINYAEKAKEIIEKLDNSRQGQQTLSTIEIDLLRPLRSQYLSLLGSAYLFGSASDDKAIGYFQQNLELAKNLPSSNNKVTAITSAYTHLGSANAFLGKYDKAIEYYEEVLAVLRSIKEPQFEKINRQIEGANLQSLSAAYASKGNIKKSVKYAQESLAIARENNNLYGKAGALGNLGRTLFLAGNLPEAEKTLREAIKIFESVRISLGEKDLQKVSFFDIYTDVYELLQQILIAQNKPIAALEIAEQGRAKSFSELLVSRAGLRKTPDTSFNLEQIKKVAKEQNATLVEYSIIYDSSQALVPARIQGLQPNQESKLLIWVVQPSGEVKFRQVDLKKWRKQHNISLGDKIAQTRQSIVKGVNVALRGNNITLTAGDRVKLNDDEQDWEAWQVVSVDAQKNKITIRLPSWEASQPSIERPITDVVQKVTNSSSANAKNPQLQELYQLLIQPIADFLPKDETARVIFIPQGALFFVPFPALQDANGEYLIDKHTILTAPSIQVLNLTHQQRKLTSQSSKNVVVVGNPTMPQISKIPGQPPRQLESLPNAEKEAKAIASKFQTQPLIGKQATKANILPLLPKARIIHLATHGLLDDFTGGGVPGAVALAPSGKDNGLLTAGEILDLKLNAELVVLSACDTGSGRITGDGVIGLSRSLITAGVNSVIVSLWSIPDAPTATLMREFYQNNQKMDRAAALREAMLKVKREKPEPRNWAAFTLIGESE